MLTCGAWLGRAGELEWGTSFLKTIVRLERVDMHAGAVWNTQCDTCFVLAPTIRSEEECAWWVGGWCAAWPMYVRAFAKAL